MVKVFALKLCIDSWHNCHESSTELMKLHKDVPEDLLKGVKTSDYTRQEFTRNMLSTRAIYWMEFVHVIALVELWSIDWKFYVLGPDKKLSLYTNVLPQRSQAKSKSLALAFVIYRARARVRVRALVRALVCALVCSCARARARARARPVPFSLLLFVFALPLGINVLPFSAMANALHLCQQRREVMSL